MLRSALDNPSLSATTRPLTVRTSLTALAAATLLLTSCARYNRHAETRTITIFSSRAIAGVLDVVGPEFERSTGHTLKVVSGFSPVFVEQIKAGASFDIIVGPTPTVDALVRDNLVLADSRVELARSGFGVAVRAGALKPNVNTVEAFKQTLLDAKSIGYLQSAGVPRLIERLGLIESLRAKTTIPSADVVAELVAKGELALGIVAITQIVTTRGVELAGPLPPALQYHVSFAAGVGANSQMPQAARALIRFLREPSAAAVIRAHGMELMP
jgi:molybdate transport system substrate-binding protein